MSTTLEQVKKITDCIEGWLTKKEGELLYRLAKQTTRGAIVEIGSYKGKSTIWLAAGSKMGSSTNVYAIDPHTGSSEHRRHGRIWTFDEFKENIKKAGVDDIVVPIVKTSEDAERDWRETPIGLLWIDGAHEYKWAKLDFELWFPHLVDGGWIAFHDSITWPGPRKVVDEEMLKSRYFKNVGIVDLIIFGRKVVNNDLKDRIRNRCILIYKKLMELERLLTSALKIICNLIGRHRVPLQKTSERIAKLIDKRERGLSPYWLNKDGIYRKIFMSYCEPFRWLISRFRFS